MDDHHHTYVTTQHNEKNNLRTYTCSNPLREEEKGVAILRAPSINIILWDTDHRVRRHDCVTSDGRGPRVTTRRHRRLRQRDLPWAIAGFLDVLEPRMATMVVMVQHHRGRYCVPRTPTMDLLAVTWCDQTPNEYSHQRTSSPDAACPLHCRRMDSTHDQSTRLNTVVFSRGDREVPAIGISSSMTVYLSLPVARAPNHSYVVHQQTPVNEQSLGNIVPNWPNESPEYKYWIPPLLPPIPDIHHPNMPPHVVVSWGVMPTV